MGGSPEKLEIHSPGRKNVKRKNSLCLAQQAGHSWGKQSPGHCEGHGLTALGGFSSCIYR